MDGACGMYGQEEKCMWGCCRNTIRQEITWKTYAEVVG